MSPATWVTGFASGVAPNIDHETFYAAYTFEASAGELSAKDNKRVAAYLEASRQLLDEIQAKFQELGSAAPAVRAAGLAQLAAQQDGRLRALAGDAEAIRLALVSSIHYFDPALFERRGRSSDASTRTTLELLFAASFYAGLSTEQRLLLPEIAFEQASPLRKEVQGWTKGSGFFFLPATARIQPPADLPPALEEKIRTFVREKENLKSELRRAALRDDHFFSWKRSRQLTALAEQQAPRFAALDTLAEEIRVELTGLGFPDQTESLALPSDLTERVGSFYARKAEARRKLLTRLRELRSEYPAGKFEIVRQGDGLAIVQSSADPKAEASLAEFNASQARRYTAFARESEILRRDIQHRLASNPQRSARTVDQLAADFARAYAVRENGDRYRDYTHAVLEPGLSPAQRRLLFQAATAELEQTGRSIQP